MIAIALPAGWLADLLAGDPSRWHPVAGYGAWVQRVEARLYRDSRWSGTLFAAVVVGLPVAAVALVERRLRPRGRRVLLAALTWAALGGRSLGREASSVGAAVRHGNEAAARERLRALCSRDPARLDATQLCRAATESVAENTADAVVATLAWGAAAGPVGVVAHRCANTVDAMVGYRSPRYARFGWAAARLDDVLGWMPARLTVLLAAACAPLVGGAPRAAVAAAVRDGGRHPSPNAGRAEAAFAGALGLRLGGASVYHGVLEQRGVLGDGRVPGPADVERAVRLSTLVGAAAALLAAAAVRR